MCSKLPFPQACYNHSEVYYDYQYVLQMKISITAALDNLGIFLSSSNYWYRGGKKTPQIKNILAAFPVAPGHYK